MNISDNRLAGLRRYHADRPARTRAKLLQALDRMERDQTFVVGPGFKWSKATLAREAGININTVVRKLPGGAWAFPDVNVRFEDLRRRRRRAATAIDSRERTIIELRREMKELREQNRRLAIEVNHLGHQILQERDRADRMAIYEEQNMQLREEIMRKAVPQFHGAHTFIGDFRRRKGLPPPARSTKKRQSSATVHDL